MSTQLPLVEDLLSRMTIREKAGQMTQLTIDAVCYGKPYRPDDPLRLDPSKVERVVVQYGVGSLLNVGTYAHSRERWRELLAELLDACRQTRLRIPILYGIDSIHGANFVRAGTLFPQQLALAAGWNPELVTELAAISAYETRAAGIGWNFSPVCDLGRHPAWPRLWETFGEDVHLVSRLTEAMTRGYQGDAIGDHHRVAACLKHFVGYGFPLSGKDRTPAWIPERQLREYFLPPFQYGIAAGAATVMVNSAELNGLPVHADHYLLTDVLRRELQFHGLVVTDWEDIKYLHTRHRVAETYKEAVRLAILAGIDLSMTPLDTEFTDYLIELVEEGAIPEVRLDESVRRILQLKADLGLFDDPLPAHENYTDFSSPAFHRKALEAARESIILLKNERNTLPLSTDLRLLVCGPTAHTLRSLHGGWTHTWQGERTDELAPSQPTVLTALMERWGGKNIRYIQAVTFDRLVDVSAVGADADLVDAIVVCLGESSYTEFFGSLDDLYLPAEQEALVDMAVSTGKPVIVVLLQGRPRLISRFADKVDAILCAFYPGEGGARAIAEILAGDYAPSARLPLTYPRYPNALLTYDHKATENLELQGIAGQYDPQFPFGHGLTYTTFSYEDLALSRTELHRDETLDVQVTIRNTGARAAAEIVQLYLRDHYATITPPVRRLIAFRKIYLSPGETRAVTFPIKDQDLGFVGKDLRWTVENGDFTLYTGNLSACFRLS